MTAVAQKITEIDDVRAMSEFKGITFSGYKKTEVRNQI